MRLILLVLMLGSLMACAPVREATNVAPDAQKGGLFGLGINDNVETSGGAPVKGGRRAVVPYFKIAFYTENSPGGYSNV